MFKYKKYEIVEFEEMSDIYVVNTCTVTNQSDAKSRKIIRQARKSNKDAILVVCGCASEHHKENIVDLDIDILIGNYYKSKIVEYVEEYKNYDNIFEQDLFDEINLNTCVEKRISLGGTSPKSVEEQIVWIKEQLKNV